MDTDFAVDKLGDMEINGGAAQHIILIPAVIVFMTRLTRFILTVMASFVSLYYK